jgi:acyl-CoA thioester hydrolase
VEPRLKEIYFRHKWNCRVRSHECDRQGVVHNARYLEMLEIARIEFCRDAFAIPMDHGTFVTHDKFYFVRNAIDYFRPARFDDELEIYTRVSKIGRTSITLEQILSKLTTDESPIVRVIECESVMVAVDPETDVPIPIPENLRHRILIDPYVETV